MADLNKVQFIGRLGQDPDIRTMSSGDRVANLSIATSESWKNKSTGEKNERTQWHRVVVFNQGLIGVIERYVQKGAKIFIEGQLEHRKWTDQSGVEKYTTEVVLRPFKSEMILLSSNNQSGGSSNAGGGTGYQSPPPATTDAGVYNDEDEIPF